MAPDAYIKSSIPKAMAKINKKILPKKHHPQDNLNIEHNVTIDDQCKQYLSILVHILHSHFSANPDYQRHQNG